jgi:cell division protein ZapA (FtsZ GTPase activity inhibitor)
MKSSNQMTLASNEGQIKRFIKYVKDGENLIVAAYNGMLDDESVNQEFDTLHNLKEQRILMSAFDGYRLNPLLSRLLNLALNIDRTRYIEVGFKSRLISIQRITESYIDHMRAGENELAVETLDDLEQLTFEIIFDAQGAISSLANRLQTKFGFVHSLRDKIAENKSAINTAGELVDNLTAFKFNDMMEYVHNCNDDHKLYSILCINLLDEITKCQTKLNSILTQLREMQSVFRKEVLKTNLLKSFCEKYYKQKGYQPENYVSDKIPNELFLKAESLKLTVHADIQNDNHKPLLINIVNSLKNTCAQLKIEDKLIAKGDFSNPPEILVEETKFEDIEDDIFEFFINVAENHKQSALAYFKEKQLTYPEAHWLFAVMAFYENMSEEKKALFPKIDYIGHRQLLEQNMGNTILEDIVIEAKLD